MNLLEDELKAALRREVPPPGFAERVLSRTPAHRPAWREKITSFFRVPVLRWAAVGLLAGCLLLGTVLQQRWREQRLRAEGELAKAQVLQALEIASSKLNTARRRVHEVGRKSLPPRLPGGEEESQI